MHLSTRPEDLHRIRVEHMERQLANLTGLVQKALIQTPGNINQNYLGVPGQYRGKTLRKFKLVFFQNHVNSHLNEEKILRCFKTTNINLKWNEMQRKQTNTLK